MVKYFLKRVLVSPNIPKTEQDLVSFIDNNNNTIDYAKLKDITYRIEQGDQTPGRLTLAEERGRADGGAAKRKEQIRDIPDADNVSVGYVQF